MKRRLSLAAAYWLAACLVLSSCGTPFGGSNDMTHLSVLTCAAPDSFATNWAGRCGVERWSVKTGTDPTAPLVSLAPVPTTIAELGALVPPGTLPAMSRSAPTEETVYELKDVTLAEVKLETDSDFHLVLRDGSHTMIAEIPYPGCTTSSRFACLITHARSAADAFSPSGSFTMINKTVTVIGVGFFDIPHGQTGIAPNAIELHPVLAMCVGAGCDPRAH